MDETTSPDTWCVNMFDEIKTAILLLLPADGTEHIRMDVQTDIGHVIKMFAGNKPDDLADLTFRIIFGHASKSV